MASQRYGNIWKHKKERPEFVLCTYTTQMSESVSTPDLFCQSEASSMFVKTNFPCARSPVTWLRAIDLCAHAEQHHRPGRVIIVFDDIALLHCLFDVAERVSDSHALALPSLS